MGFPSSPTNGQQVVVNNITYVYNSTKGAWLRLSTPGVPLSANSLVITSPNVSISTTSGALIVTGGAGIGGNLHADRYYTHTGLYWANNNESILGGLTYGNTEVAAYLVSQKITSANIGGSQIFANANAAIQAVAIDSINANLGAFQTYANANVGTLFLGNVSTNANLGAYQIYANSNAASQQTQIDSLVTNANTNTAAYLSTYTGNVQVGNISVTGNAYVTSNVFANIFYVSNSIRWAGNGAVFASGGGGGGGGITYTASNTAPASATVGDQWYYIAGDILFEYINDGDSDQWVDMTSPVAPSSTVVSDLILSNVSISSVYSTTAAKTALGIIPTVGTTPPASPARGDYWYNTAEDILYQFTYDGTSNYWVDITSETFSSSAGSRLLDTTITGNLIPSANITYDLGSSAYRFRDIWLSGNTIRLGGANISTDGSNVTITNPQGGSFSVAGSANNSANVTFGNVFANYFFANGSPFTTSNYGNSQVAAYLASSNSVVGTGALTLPSGTTAQRTGNVAGALRLNTETNYVEIYSIGGIWANLIYAGGYITASGGNSSYTSGNYKIHVFTASGTFQVTNAPVGATVEYLVVAGGGGGGYDYGGGGGGGGVVYNAAQTVASNQSYTITVGAGGAAGVSGGPKTGVSGSNSSAFSATAIGGGGGLGGAAAATEPARSGGSGGGGGWNLATGGQGTAGQGFAGGNGFGSGPSSNVAPGGGGGSAAPGANGAAGQAGAGGSGASYPQFNAVGASGYFAGGGGGGGYAPYGVARGLGGQGGGGAGGLQATVATAGTVNTGGGGGGDGGGPGIGAGAGASGIVIISYRFQ